MKKIIKQREMDYHETCFSSERMIEKIRDQNQNLIELTVLRYLENFPDQSERNPLVLWTLAQAYHKV